jgi:hypothetical protein
MSLAFAVDFVFLLSLRASFVLAVVFLASGFLLAADFFFCAKMPLERPRISRKDAKIANERRNRGHINFMFYLS